MVISRICAILQTPLFFNVLGPTPPPQFVTQRRNVYLMTLTFTLCRCLYCISVNILVPALPYKYVYTIVVHSKP